METNIGKSELEVANEAIRARDVFLSHVAHELRTPLTALKLQVQIRQRALTKGEVTKFTPELLSTMFSDDIRQITKLAQLIDEMLDVSRANLSRT